MRTKIALSTLALVISGLAAGCGQTSYFEVTVRVPVVSTADVPCLISMIDSCEVTVSGADSDSFTLVNNVCVHVPPSADRIGTFQYATDKESGSVSFKVAVFNGNRRVGPAPSDPVGPMGEGTAAGAIKAGGRQVVMVTVAPNAAFRCQ